MSTGRISSVLCRLALTKRASFLPSFALALARCPQAKYLNKMLHGYLKYDMPLWLTEFACADEADKMNATGQASYLADALKLLELHPAVARYAW